MRRKHTQRYFVGDKGYPNAGAALSYAQGLACRWTLEHDEERSFYVRDWNDIGLFRVDIVNGGIYTTEVKTAA